MTNQSTNTFGIDLFKQAETAINAGKSQIEGLIQASNEAAVKQYEQFAELARKQVETASSTALTRFEAVAEMNRANVEAVVKATTITTEGVETVNRHLLDISRQQLDSSVETARKLAGAKSPQEVFDLQSNVARQNVDTMLAESRKVGEMTQKVANDALVPLRERTNATVETVLKPAA